MKKGKRKIGGELSVPKNAIVYILFFACLSIVIVNLVGYTKFLSVEYNSAAAQNVLTVLEKPKPKWPPLDRVDYDGRVLSLANLSTTTASTTPKLWPVKSVYPKDGAILPFKRVIAYYGNFLSKGMGVLGEYPADEMISKLKAELESWAEADPETPTIPAIHYIAVTAQGSAGKEGKYILRMADSEIDHALELAEQVNGIVFLDIQVGLSDIRKEVPMLEKYLKMPNVHLGVDPEFYMKTGARPGTVIGSMDAEDINYVTEYLAKLVNEYDLPPKILVIHRFTDNMVTNYKSIKIVPEVQFVMNMDGWGTSLRKKGTYSKVVYSEPVQFTGFKIFYKNDLRPPSEAIMTPKEVLKLKPRPIYIQYQ